MGVDAEGIPFRMSSLERRVDRLEELEPAVMANELKNLREEVGSLRKAFYTFAFGAVGSAVIFAFTTFALLGKHP